jgi:hypothetical protein
VLHDVKLARNSFVSNQYGWGVIKVYYMYIQSEDSRWKFICVVAKQGFTIKYCKILFIASTTLSLENKNSWGLEILIQFAAE